MRGRPAVLIDSSARMPSTPSASPMTPPITDSSTLSVSSCRMMRPRPAPIAARSATSRLRAVARTSSRLATLAHAISRTKATAALRISSVGRAFLHEDLLHPLDAEAVVRHRAPSETSRVNSCAESFSLACACSSDTPGLSRAGGLKEVALIDGVRIELERDPQLWRLANLGEIERRG